MDKLKPGLTRRDAMVLALSSVALSRGAAAQESADQFPSKPIKMIIPVPPGSGVDFVGRTIGEGISMRLGQPVVQDYRPGAGASIGTRMLATSPPDGYTMMTGYGAQATNPIFQKDLPYDSVNDFIPLVYACSAPLVLSVNADVPAKNVPELVDLVKKNPDKYSIALGSIGNAGHLSGELLKHYSGMKILNVPFSGNAPALNALIGGHVNMMFDLVATSMPHVGTGKLRILAVTGSQRLASAPDIPTLKESGFPEFDVVAWYMLFLPAKVPQPIVAKLNKAANETLQDPKMKARFAEMGFDVVGGTPEETKAFFLSEVKRWGDLAKATGMGPEPK